MQNVRPRIITGALFIVLAAAVFPACTVIGDIFKAGAIMGVIVVVIILAVIFAIARMFKK